ncbi:MAG: hypothetical protein JST39_10750 [Bacteroidetes bacterium]|nr:hypothetical protein [Bacteroidota bacterium]
MAKIPEGILGVLIGSLGPVTGKKWKKLSTLSSKRTAAKTDKNPTGAQKVQRSKMGVVSGFHKGSKNLVKLTFKEPATDITEFQCAISYNMCNAVSYTDDGYVLHYDRTAIGRGTLPNAEFPEVKAGDKQGDVRFLWADNTGVGQAAADDTAILVVYDPDWGHWIWNREQPVRRADSGAALSLPAYSGKTVHTWLTFVSAAGKSADSIYTGALKVV